jgi:3-phytase
MIPFALALALVAQPDRTVQAAAETSLPGAASSEAGALWLNSREPSQSRLICTQTGGGLNFFDLSGGKVSTAEAPSTSSLATRVDLTLEGKKLALAALGTSAPPTVGLWTIEARTGELKDAGRVPLDGPPAAIALAPGDTSPLLAIGIGTRIELRSLARNGASLTSAILRTLQSPGPVRALAIDARAGMVYFIAGGTGLCRAPLDGSNAPRVISDEAGDGAGLALHAIGEGGYLLASHPGGIQVIERGGANRNLGSVRVTDSASVDGCTGAGAITSLPDGLGATFPRGVVALWDQDNQGSPANFKLIAWEKLASAFRPALEGGPAVSADDKNRR